MMNENIKILTKNKFGNLGPFRTSRRKGRLIPVLSERKCPRSRCSQGYAGLGEQGNWGQGSGPKISWDLICQISHFGACLAPVSM